MTNPPNSPNTAHAVTTANQHRDPTAFGAVLLAYRMAAGLTQQRLAARAGISPDAVAALERGKRRSPRFATVAALATALELDVQARHAFIVAARGLGGPEGTASVADTKETDASELAQPPRSAWWSAAEPTPLVDRTQELETILGRLRVASVRLLTLVGPAGVGKTRLALTAAAQLAVGEDTERFPDGVTWIDLTPVREPALVLGALARALGLLDIGRRPLLERLVEALAARRLLLALDNFEQALPTGAAQLADLLSACPGLTLLVTSRVPLGLRWEQTLRIAPLPVPDLRAALPTLDALLAIPAVELFVGRARAQRADFTLGEQHARVVAQVTAQLDGLPLALELAAARLEMLTLPTLAGRLGDRLRLLASEAPDRPVRQRSLEAAIGWSYDLLSADEQRLFRCLGVFIGRVTLDAITTVVDAIQAVGVGGTAGLQAGEREAWDAGRTLPQLVSLAEKSLLLPAQPDDEKGGAEAEEEEGPEPAFSMLETVREYAQERLAVAGELAAASRAHAHYYLALAEWADPQLRGPDQRVWFFRLEREHDNLRAALRWFLDHGGPDGPAKGEAGLRLAGALGWFWLMRGYHIEGGRWLREALDRAPAGKEGDGVNLAARTRALLAAGPLLTVQTEFARTQEALEEALALAQQQQDHASIAQALSYLGLRAVMQGDLAVAHRALADARTRWEDLGERFYLGFTFNLLGAIAFAQGDYTHAESLVSAALEWLAAAGDKREAGITHINFAVVAWQRGDPLNAASHLRAGLHTSVTLQDRFLLAQGLRPILGLTAEHIDPERQARLLGALETLNQATGGMLGSYERLPAYPNVAALRARLGSEGWASEEWAEAYREGQALPLAEIAALTLTLVDEVAEIQAQSRSAHQPGAARSQRPQEQPFQRPDHSSLTAREQEVLRLVAEGLSNKAMGRLLFLAPSTVNHHLTSIFNKLGVNTRAQAVAEAARRGLL